MYIEKIEELVLNKAKSIYGSPLPKVVSTSIDNELSVLDEKKAKTFYIASILAEELKQKNIPFELKTFTNPPLIGFLLGLININPMPAHYLCSTCHHIEFDNSALCGVDLADRKCPICHSLMHKDGYDVSMFQNANKRDADISFVFDAKDISNVYKDIENLFYDYKVIRMYLKIDKKTNIVTAYTFKETPSLDYESEGIYLLPKESDIEFIDGDIISYDDDLALYNSSIYIGISSKNHITDEDKAALNEIMSVTQPETFDDKIRTAGLFIGYNLWEENAKDLIEHKNFSLNEVITCRTDVYNKLLMYGYSTNDAWDISEKVRKGKSLSEKDVEIMKQNNIPLWFIQSCKKIRYAPTRGMCVMFAINNKL